VRKERRRVRGRKSVTSEPALKELRPTKLRKAREESNYYAESSKSSSAGSIPLGCLEKDLATCRGAGARRCVRGARWAYGEFVLSLHLHFIRSTTSSPFRAQDSRPAVHPEPEMTDDRVIHGDLMPIPADVYDSDPAERRLVAPGVEREPLHE